jgi:ribosome-associated protein
MDNNHKSRTQQKNEDRALQMLGQELVDLSSQQLQNIKIPDEILEAVRFARKITRHGARRRQIQRIRALLREVDVESIQNALITIKHGYNRQTLAFKKVEKWRDDLKEGNKVLIEEILSICPDVERQRLTQLARNANKEYLSGKGVKSSRILFRYLSRISDPLSFSKTDEE